MLLKLGTHLCQYLMSKKLAGGVRNPWGATNAGNSCWFSGNEGIAPDRNYPVCVILRDPSGSQPPLMT